VIERTIVLVLRRATGAATSILVNDYGPPAAFPEILVAPEIDAFRQA
jgi:hypothetical protein